MIRGLGVAVLAVTLIVSACSNALPALESTTTTAPTTTTTTTEPAPTTTTTRPPGPTESARGLAAWVDSVEAAGPSSARVMVSEFWDENDFPLVFRDQVAFFYEGDADSVVWNGDFNRWGAWEGVVGERIADTDLWVGYLETLPPDARVLYKVVVDGEWLLDPGNDVTQMGGFGPNSELTMPLFTETAYRDRVPGVPRGRLVSGVLSSVNLGYDVAYEIYTPAGSEDMSDLPLLVVTDGSDWSDREMGATPTILDNLIDAGTVEPLIAVFVDAWDPERQANRRETEFLERPEEFGRFLADEVVPFVDSSYPTEGTRESRAVIGTSFGGLAVTYLALLEAGTFAKFGFFSPSWWGLESPSSLPTDRAAEVARTLGAAALDGTGDPDSGEVQLFLGHGDPDWDVGPVGFVALDWAETGIDHEVVQVQEGHTWGAWSSMTDEMLEFFFPR